MAWTRAVHLDTWGSEQESRHTLPLLVRRLALRTLRSIQKLDFPAGEQIGRSGFDGTIKTDEGNRFVPTGASAWEMGAGDNPKKKANDDFKTRTEKTSEEERKNIHFVFVTCRNWEGKGEWIDEKSEKPEWASISVLDANDLEHWLEIAPDVDVWLSHLMGRVSEGVEGLEAYWKRLRAIAETPLLPSVFTVSREEEMGSLRKWLVEPADSLFIQTDGLTDGLDFLSAFAQQDEQELLKFALIVDTREAWQRLSASRESLILVSSPTLQLSSADTAGAVENGHYVFISGPRGIVGKERSLKLRRQDHYQVGKALQESGFSESKARSFARAFCGSSSILKRLIAQHPDTAFPDWSHPDERTKLAAFALAGGWADVEPKLTSEGEDRPRLGSPPPQDVSVVTKLIGCTKEELETIVTRWRQGPEPLFIRFRNEVLVASREDAWYLLASSITNSQLNRFKDLAVIALSEDNPKFDLEPDKQWMANVYGKSHTLSSDLRDSLIETLALMNTYRTADESDVTKVFPSAVSAVLEQILPAKSTWQRWASLGPNLMVIAEADPDFLLRRIENDLESEDPSLPELFIQHGSHFFGSSNHTNLLWSLESMAWSPEFLNRVAIVLAKLATRIANIKTNANRPEASLTEIFLLWLWHTNASKNQRIKALSDVLEADPQAGWNLLKSILPGGLKTTSMNTYIPRWRPWADGWSREKVNSEFCIYGMAVAELTISVAGKDPDKWAEIVDNMLRFNSEITSKVISELTALAHDKAIAGNPSFQLWKELREIVAKHEQYEDAEWTFDEDLRLKLAEIRDKIAPDDAILRNQWLFDLHVRLSKVDADNFKAHEKALHEARERALQGIVTQAGANGVFRLLELAPAAYHIGWIIGDQRLLSPSEAKLPEILDSEQRSDLEFINSYVARRFFLEQWTFIKSLGIGDWTEKQISALARCLPFNEEIWAWIEARGQGVKSEYWRSIRGYLYEPTLLSVRIAINALIEVGRPFEAIDHLHVAFLQKVELESDYIASVLEAALHIKDVDPAETRKSRSYEIQQLVGALQKDKTFDRPRLAHIEWGFLPALDKHSSPVRPDTLIDALGAVPSLFIDLLKLMFRGKNESPRAESLSEPDQQRAEYAYQLINDIDRLPGTEADKVDYTYLRTWIDDVRTMATECDRISVCDITIGQIMARASKDSDGICVPSPELAALMQQIGSEKLFDGLVNGIMNSRGTTWRNPLDGGKQERELAARYRELADTYKATSSKLAEALKHVARYYEANAVMEDEDAAREKIGR
jgi:hypothetical protein